MGNLPGALVRSDVAELKGTQLVLTFRACVRYVLAGVFARTCARIIFRSSLCGRLRGLARCICDRAERWDCAALVMAARVVNRARRICVFARLIHSADRVCLSCERSVLSSFQPLIGFCTRAFQYFSCFLFCTMAEGDARAEAAAELLSHIGDEQAQRAAALEERRRALQEERKSLAKEIRNEERKRKRRLEKARGLSNDDLLEIAASRAAQAKAKAGGKAKAKAKAGA